jgi:hypothetical protein
MNNYIYLLREREFIKTGEEVYKIGKTEQEGLKRFKNYPNGSELLLHIKCENCSKSERILIDMFKIKYEQRKDIGAEYFEGNCDKMMKDIIDNVLEDKNDIITGSEFLSPYLNKMVEAIENKNNKLEGITETESNAIKNEMVTKSISLTIEFSDGTMVPRGELYNCHTSLKFLKSFIEDSFRGGTFLNEEKPKDDYGFRFRSSDICGKYEIFKKNIGILDAEPLRSSWNKINILPKQMRIVKGGKTVLGYVIHPPTVRIIIEKISGIKGFKFEGVNIIFREATE